MERWVARPGLRGACRRDTSWVTTVAAAISPHSGIPWPKNPTHIGLRMKVLKKGEPTLVWGWGPLHSHGLPVGQDLIVPHEDSVANVLLQSASLLQLPPPPLGLAQL